MGQGEVLTTPIQMAKIVSAIANRGFYVQRHFVKKVNSGLSNSYGGGGGGLKGGDWDMGVEGRWGGVEKGTARIAKGNNRKIAGKTGTIGNRTVINNERKQSTEHAK
jgi:Cell division protein FtsI/penicillin-binding protein 2